MGRDSSKRVRRPQRNARLFRTPTVVDIGLPGVSLFADFAGTTQLPRCASRGGHRSHATLPKRAGDLSAVARPTIASHRSNEKEPRSFFQNQLSISASGR